MLILPRTFLHYKDMKQNVVRISRRIFTKSSHRTGSCSIASIANNNSNYVFCSTFHSASFQKKPRLDFNRINEVNDATSVFRDMVRMRPMPCGVEFNKLLTLVVKMKQYHVALSLFDEMRQLGVPLSDITMSIAINCYCSLNRVELGFAILGIFFKRGYNPTVSAFTTLIKGLFLENKAADAEKLFKKLLSEKLCEPNDEIILSTVLNGLCKAGYTLTSLNLLCLLEKGSCMPDVYAYSIVIDSLCKDGMVDKARGLLNQMINRGISPTVVTYSSIIQGCCSFGKWKEAKDLLIEMVARRISLTVVTYSILVDAFCKEGKVKEAEGVLEIMRQRSICPNIFTYNTLVDGCCLRGEMKKARNIVDLAVNSGLRPDIVTYNSLINGYCKKGNVDEAWRLFLEIPGKGLEHTTFSYNIMLGGLFRANRFTAGWKLFNEMQSRHIIPDLVTYNTLLDGLCRNHQISEAFSVLCMMKDNGVKPDIATYSALIYGLHKDGKLDVARDIFNKLPSKGLQPDVRTFTIIIGALAEGLTQEADNFLLKMEQYNCLPNSVTYNVYAQGLLKANECKAASRILDEMARKGFSPDSATVSMLLASQDGANLLLGLEVSTKN